jgi:hypothetical protein
MFTRIIELTTKPGKNKQLADAIDESSPGPEETERVLG